MKLHPYQDNDFETRDTTELMNTIGSVTGIVGVLLLVFSVITLVVGGIGIMNIMLVSVTERIREIGLRMAIGATPANILVQFVFEAIVLATVGGAAGVLAGIGASHLVGGLAGWPVLIEPASAAYAFLISTVVGLFFGFNEQDEQHLALIIDRQLLSDSESTPKTELSSLIILCSLTFCFFIFVTSF